MQGIYWPRSDVKKASSTESHRTTGRTTPSARANGYIARPQNKKDRTITLRVGYEVAEGAVGNADNDQVNCYQTVIKSWKSALRWMGYLP